MYLRATLGVLAGVLGEEAEDFGRGVGAFGVGVGAGGAAAGPGVAHAVDDPLLHEGVALHVQVARAGVGVAAGCGGVLDAGGPVGDAVVVGAVVGQVVGLRPLADRLVAVLDVH